MNNKNHNAPPSLLSIETKAAAERVKQLLDIVLNGAFALTRKASRVRQTLFAFLLFLTGFILGLRVVAWSIWLLAIRTVFVNIFSLDLIAINSSLETLLTLAWNAFFSRETIKYLPVFLTPFLLALHFASVYLQDIFELEQVSIARRFILRAAFGTSYEKIHIREGQIAEENKNSPLFLVGGPGLVQVELDSAALFEDADGHPRVIGPTIATGFVELTGFERLREAYDIRDHFTKPLTVGGRSLDGIIMAAQDVRLVYSVWRGEKPEPPTLEKPYPFEHGAIFTLTYSQSYNVTPGGGAPSKGAPWYNAMLGIIRRKLGGFISSHKLEEFLSSINVPEIQKVAIREATLNDHAEKIAEVNNGSPDPDLPSLPEFQPRDKISSMFVRFTEEFTETEKKKGVELHWIGVGTWQPPSEVNARAIAEKYLDAWRISRDNAGRGGGRALKTIQHEIALQETMRLIQDVPSGSLLKIRKDPKARQTRPAIIQRIILEYRDQLKDAIASYNIKLKQYQTSPEKLQPGKLSKTLDEIQKKINDLEAAVRFIDKVLGIRWVHPSTDE